MKNNIRINVIVNIIRTVVLTLLSFITFPWVCRYLGDSAVGTYTWANTFVAYFLILAKIGIPNLAVRECVKVRDNKEELSNKVQGFFLLQLISTILSFGLLCVVVFSVPALREQHSLIFILSLNFLVGAFSFEWVFIALEKQFYMAVRSIVALTISAILIIVFVTTPDDILLYALIAIMVTVITTIANVYYVRRFVSFKKTMPYNLKQYSKQLLVLCTLSLVLSIYNQTDTFILGFINSDKTEVASYSVGIKGVDIIIGIITALSVVFIPRAAYYYSKEDKRFFNNLNKYSINICLFIVLPAIVTMCVLAKPICGLISGSYTFQQGDDYYNAPYVLMILAAMMATYSIGDIIYGQILLPMKKEKYYLIAISVGALVNAGASIGLGMFLFKDRPAIGVAIGTVTTDVLIIIFLLALTWKWTRKTVFNMNTLKLLIANAVILGVSLLIYNPLLTLWKNMNLSDGVAYTLQLVAIVAIAGIIYLVILFLLKEDLIYSFSKKRKEERKNAESES
ncbi:MAG: oligosaccharide flippase family protein [Bacilli bacterium]|nr:oligosaccharide flippase family protein [Bacilli bacterium]